MLPQAAAQTLVPDAPRVIYEKNPLERVICQLRFPDILRIGDEPPVRFQERIRAVFPLYKEPQLQLEVPIEVPAEVKRWISSEIGSKGSAPAQFISADESWLVSLANAFLGLTTTQYRRWEEFREKLTLPLNALLEEYKPAFFTRIGLRYRDVIRRNSLGLEGYRWSELLRPQILGELGDNAIADAAEEVNRKVLLKWGEKSKLRLAHGLAVSESGEICYVIDSDFFTNERVEMLEHAITILDNFNRSAGNLFRWCIQDRLADAMGPSPIQSGRD